MNGRLFVPPTDQVGPSAKIAKREGAAIKNNRPHMSVAQFSKKLNVSPAEEQTS